jgi:hypothetical protein
MINIEEIGWDLDVSTLFLRKRGEGVFSSG